MSGWMCNILDGGDRHIMYWMVEIPVSGWLSVHHFVGDTSIRMAIALLEIPMLGWMCNIVDGGDRHVMYWMVDIPVSGWPSLCWRYQCQDG